MDVAPLTAESWLESCRAAGPPCRGASVKSRISPPLGAWVGLSAALSWAYLGWGGGGGRKSVGRSLTCVPPGAADSRAHCRSWPFECSHGIVCHNTDETSLNLILIY